MSWKLRYASHLGYRSVEEPLLRASVAGLDPVAHIARAAELGFVGVQYALAASRDAAEQQRVGDALAQHGLEAGCMIWTSFDKLRLPLWGEATASAREQLLAELGNCAQIARRTGARRIAVVGAADPRLPLALQQQRFVENLKWAADYAQEQGLTLCLESLSRRSLQGMLAHHILEAYAIVKAVDNPAVRLIFDTGHVQAMDGDLLENLAATWDAIAIVQIADNPGRFEPGTGEINFANLLSALWTRGYRGLVELEHLWASPSLAAEAKLLEDLRTIEAGFAT